MQQAMFLTRLPNWSMSSKVPADLSAIHTSENWLPAIAEGVVSEPMPNPLPDVGLPLEPSCAINAGWPRLVAQMLPLGVAATAVGELTPPP